MCAKIGLCGRRVEGGKDEERLLADVSMHLPSYSLCLGCPFLLSAHQNPTYSLRPGSNAIYSIVSGLSMVQKRDDVSVLH